MKGKNCKICSYVLTFINMLIKIHKILKTFAFKRFKNYKTNENIYLPYNVTVTMNRWLS